MPSTANAIAETRSRIDFSRPINLQLRIRNNILLQAIRNRAPTVAAFCRATGYPQTVANEYVAFKRNPVVLVSIGRGKKKRVRSEWRESAVRLCTLLDLTPEEAFPVEVCEKVERNTVEVFCVASAPTEPQLSPLDEVMRDAISENVARVLRTLTEREKYALERRFALRGGDEETYEQIGSALGVSRERVRQIVSKGIRKLRHPARVLLLRDAMESIKDLESMKGTQQ